jgi:hypothetical protein
MDRSGFAAAELTMPESQSRVKRVADVAVGFFVVYMLLDWRSVAGWDWRHINRLSGAFAVVVSLARVVGGAILFGIFLELMFFGWFMPKLLQWRSHRHSRT